MATPMVKEIINLAAQGIAEVTFELPAVTISVLTDRPLYIASTAAALGVPSTGKQNQRFFVPGGSDAYSPPWGKERKVYLKNIETDVLAIALRIQVIGTV